MIAASPGCHTLEGAANGAGRSYAMLANGNSPAGASAGAGGVVMLVAIAAGPLLGAVYGAGQDLAGLWFEIEDSTSPGVPWDSPEGRALRRWGAPGPR